MREVPQLRGHMISWRCYRYGSGAAAVTAVTGQDQRKKRQQKPPKIGKRLGEPRAHVSERQQDARSSPQQIATSLRSSHDSDPAVSKSFRSAEPPAASIPLEDHPGAIDIATAAKTTRVLALAALLSPRRSPQLLPLRFHEGSGISPVSSAYVLLFFCPALPLYTTPLLPSPPTPGPPALR